VSPIDDAFNRALAAIDDAMNLVREMHQRPRIDTLSTSLADPQGHEVEMILSAARGYAPTESERQALIAIASACRLQGLISQAAAERLVGEFQGP